MNSNKCIYRHFSQWLLYCNLNSYVEASWVAFAMLQWVVAKVTERLLSF